MTLKVKRVPTIVSNYQKDENEATARGCGRNCLRDYCIQGAKLPLYAYKRVNKLDTDKNPGFECRVGEPLVAFLDSLLLGEWRTGCKGSCFAMMSLLVKPRHLDYGTL